MNKDEQHDYNMIQVETLKSGAWNVWTMVTKNI